MRVVIASRIFAPEPSAASFRLLALAQELSDRGHDVEVLTVRSPRYGPTPDKRIVVRRWPVYRDKQGYVRGYVSYLSFDLPLLFRLLFTRADAVVVEPPPTTGVVGRIVCAIRRLPYFYYAADIWGDAASLTGAPRPILNLVRRMERWAWGGARTLLAVSTGVRERLLDLGIDTPVEMVGNGIDVEQFQRANREDHRPDPRFIYAGTASEWHGAAIFICAFAAVLDRLGSASLTFIGGGSERGALQELSEQLGVSDRVQFRKPMAPSELAPVLAGAVASLASVTPGSGYDFAFPTKLYSSAACGSPLIYAGIGPAVDFVTTEVHQEPLGYAVSYDIEEVSQAMVEAYERWETDSANPEDWLRRTRVREWAEKEVSLRGPSGRIADVIENSYLKQG